MLICVHCTDYNSDQKVSNVNAVHIAVTPWRYEGCRDLKLSNIDVICYMPLFL